MGAVLISMLRHDPLTPEMRRLVALLKGRRSRLQYSLSVQAGQDASAAAEEAQREAEKKWRTELCDYDGIPRLRLNEPSMSLVLLPDELVVSHTKLVSVEIEEDGHTIQSTDRTSQLLGAAVGGGVFGGVGAVVGGLSGSKNSREKCNRMSIKLVIDDLSAPSFVVDILRKPAWKKTGWFKSGGQYKHAAYTANHWHGVITALIRRAEQDESK